MLVILVLVLVVQGHYSWVFESSLHLAARAVWCVRGVPSNRRVKLSTIKRVSDETAMIRTTPSSVVTGRNAQGGACSETRRTKGEQIGRLAHARVTGTVFDMFVYGSHAIRDIVSDFVSGSGSWEHTDDCVAYRVSSYQSTV